MDFFGKINESLRFTFKYKSLWLFGIILGIFEGGFGGNWGNFRGDSNNKDYNEAVESIEDFFEKPGVLIGLLCLVVVGIAIALIGWYLSSVSKAALIHSVKLDAENKNPSFKTGWKYGKTKAFTFIVGDLIMAAIIILSILFSLIFIIPGIIFPPFLLSLCLLVPAYIIFAIYAGATYTGAQRYMVLKDMGAWESIKAGWILAKKSLGDYVVGWFVSLIPGCLWLILMIPLSIIAILVLVAIGIGSILASPLFGIIVIIFLVLIFVFFFAIINSPYVVFAHTYWTKVVMEMIKE
jgi:hypothetical protein